MKLKHNAYIPRKVHNEEFSSIVDADKESGFYLYFQ